MNREVEFRGKCPDNGEWYFGYLIVMKNGQTEICTNEVDNIICRINVLPETVGQFTGLLDKNGVKIFEGDIVFANLGKDFVGEVFFENTSFKIRVSDSMVIHLGCRFEFIKVIGNIHDNPELLVE
jgi:uncharacterized phage protein (TIGR01671 family)